MPPTEEAVAAQGGESSHGMNLNSRSGTATLPNLTVDRTSPNDSQQQSGPADVLNRNLPA